MPTKSNLKTRTKAGVKNKKSKISNKTIAAIVIGFVAITGIVIVFSGYAAGPPAFQYSYNVNCEKKTTNVNVSTSQIVTTTGANIATVPIDPKSECVRYSAEEQSYRLYRATNGKDPDYKSYSELVQKMAGDRTPIPELVPQSFLDQYKSKTDAEFVTKVFQNVLYRTPGDNGASWAADMKKNGWSRRDAVFIISSSPEAQNNNVGKFSQFIKTNPTAVTIVPNAQNQQNERLKQANGKIEELKILNYAILVNRNQIRDINDVAAAQTPYDKTVEYMKKTGELNKEVIALRDKSVVLNQQSPDISSTAIAEVAKQSEGYLASSWAGAVEVGSKYEDLKGSPVASGVPSSGGGGGSSSGGGGGSSSGGGGGSSSGGSLCGAAISVQVCNYYVAVDRQNKVKAAVANIGGAINKSRYINRQTKPQSRPAPRERFTGSVRPNIGGLFGTVVSYTPVGQQYRAASAGANLYGRAVNSAVNFGRRTVSTGRNIYCNIKIFGRSGPGCG